MSMPGWRLWQNCHFRHICQTCQYRQLLWAPHCFVLCHVGDSGKMSFSPYLPNSPVSLTFMSPLIALCFAMLAIVAKLSFLPYLPNSPLCSLFCHFCCCMHFWTHLALTGPAMVPMADILNHISNINAHVEFGDEKLTVVAVQYISKLVSLAT